MADRGDISDASTDHSISDSDCNEDNKTNTNDNSFSASQLPKRNYSDSLKIIYEEHNYHRQPGLDSQDNLYLVFHIQGDRRGNSISENTETNEDNSMISREYSDESCDYIRELSIDDDVDGNTNDGNEVLGEIPDDNSNDIQPNCLVRFLKQSHLYVKYILCKAFYLTIPTCCNQE